MHRLKLLLTKAVAKAVVVVMLCVLISAPSVVSAQAQSASPQAGAAGSLEKGKGVAGPRKQLATIIFAGLGGAILGLSTLSFYGRPQDNLRNIAIGTAFGVIGGTVLVTYKAATNPAELYGNQLRIERQFQETSTSLMSLASGGLSPSLKMEFEF